MMVITKSKITKIGLRINIIKQNIFDIIYLKLFLYKCRFNTKTVISKPKIMQRKARLIKDKINNALHPLFRALR